MLETQALDPDRTPFAFSDIAVICRTHRQLDRIEIALQREDILVLSLAGKIFGIPRRYAVFYPFSVLFKSRKTASLWKLPCVCCGTVLPI